MVRCSVWASVTPGLDEADLDPEGEFQTQEYLTSRSRQLHHLAKRARAVVIRQATVTWIGTGNVRIPSPVILHLGTEITEAGLRNHCHLVASCPNCRISCSGNDSTSKCDNSKQQDNSEKRVPSPHAHPTCLSEAAVYGNNPFSFLWLRPSNINVHRCSPISHRQECCLPITGRPLLVRPRTSPSGGRWHYWA